MAFAYFFVCLQRQHQWYEEVSGFSPLYILAQPHCLTCQIQIIKIFFLGAVIVTGNRQSQSEPNENFLRRISTVKFLNLFRMFKRICNMKKSERAKPEVSSISKLIRKNEYVRPSPIYWFQEMILFVCWKAFSYL